MCANVLCQLGDVTVSALTASNEKAIPNERKKNGNIFCVIALVVVVVTDVAVSVRDSFARR